MDLKGSKTEKNLAIAFAGESEARNVYLYYARVAREEGRPYAADVFEALAQNEEEHARQEFELLDRLADTKANLRAAVTDEHYHCTRTYPGMAKTAQEEGFLAVAGMFEHMAAVEGKHESICRQLLEDIAANQSPQGRTVLHSATTMAQLTLPDQANPEGFVHGGELVKIMDNAAGVVAARHARMNVVTARVDTITFLRPVVVGSLVLVSAALTFVSRSTMEVRVEVETENLGTGERQQALAAHYVMVALDKNRKAQQVPPLIVTTELGARLFEEGRQRYEAWKKQNVGNSSR